MYWVLAHRAGTHFSRPWCLIHWSGWMCLGFGSCQSSLLDAGAGETHHLCLAVKTDTPWVSIGSHLHRQGSVYRLAPEASLLKECQWGWMRFWNCRACVGFVPAPGSHTKKGSCAEFGMWSTRQISDFIKTYFYKWLVGCLGFIA